jgi:DNA-binding NtrC family response regulator
MHPSVLVIEQECLLPEADLAACASSLGGLRWERSPWQDERPLQLGDRRPDLLLLEASPEPERARRLLGWVATLDSTAPAIAMLPDRLEEAVLRAARGALDDFVLWPMRLQELRERLARLLGIGGRPLVSAGARLTAELGLQNLVGCDPTFLAAVGKTTRISQNAGNLLITGETGTGKELYARAVHHLGTRQHGPFIAVDCGAFPESLFENELFGHAAGAFTDARSEQRGLAALAEGGTLFLDEIDNLSLASQSKLLRFLQERAYRPLGSDRLRPADIRVIVATNRDLEALVAGGRFRGDLFFRLNVLHVRLPPLRERRGDIPLLAQHFLDGEARTAGDRSRSFAGSALRRLAAYHWPGNVRELQNVVQRTAVFCERPVIQGDDVVLGGPQRLEAAPAGGFRQARAEAIGSFERGYVENLLRKHLGNVTRAALEAQKERRSFGRLVKRLGLTRPPE